MSKPRAAGRRGAALTLLVVGCGGLVTACTGNAEEGNAIRQAIRAAYESHVGYVPPTRTIDSLMARLRNGKSALDDAVASVPADEQDAYKKAMCTALKTTANDGQPDWEDLVGVFGLSSPAYEFRTATEDVARRAEEGAPNSDLALWSFINYGCI